MMRSLRARAATLLSTGAAIFIVACGSDIATEPARSPARPLTPNPLGSFDRGGPTTSDVSVKFTLKPNEESYIQIGAHYLYIPANVVCDPKSSGYGVSYWEAPCKTISGPTKINVTATASILNGHPIVIFDTELRFKPTNDPRQFVMLYLRDDKGSGKSRIFWCPDAGHGPKSATPQCVDETPASLSPAQIQSRWDGFGFIYRRIEHFSGYNVTAGDSGDSTLVGGQ
jgi:hypothetical protein